MREGSGGGWRECLSRRKRDEKGEGEVWGRGGQHQKQSTLTPAQRYVLNVSTVRYSISKAFCNPIFKLKQTQTAAHSLWI